MCHVLLDEVTICCSTTNFGYTISHPECVFNRVYFNKSLTFGTYLLEYKCGFGSGLFAHTFEYFVVLLQQRFVIVCKF